VNVDALGDLGFSGNHDGVLYVLSRAYKSIEALLLCVHLHSTGENRGVLVSKGRLRCSVVVLGRRTYERPP
jgi:hypothetical protein